MKKTWFKILAGRSGELEQVTEIEAENGTQALIIFNTSSTHASSRAILAKGWTVRAVPKVEE